MEPLKVDNYTILINLPNHTEGEVAYCSNEDKYYIYINDELKWQPYNISMNSSGLNMNLYELNKSVVSQLPVFDENAWNGSEKIFNDWFFRQMNKKQKPRYFMLYGRDISYFTVFRRVSGTADFTTFFAALRDILNSVGDVYAIDPVEDDSAIEIWVRYIDEEQKIDEMTCLYLFNYDEGVITFNE